MEIDYEKLLKDIDARFLLGKRDVDAIEARLSEARIELSRLQGEYRAISKLAAKAVQPEPKATE